MDSVLSLTILVKPKTKDDCLKLGEGLAKFRNCRSIFLNEQNIPFLFEFLNGIKPMNNLLTLDIEGSNIFEK